jgi:hypothetical protein
MPPRLLQIFREQLKPDCENEYDAIEVATARIAVSLACPHPYLGAQSLSGPSEVWWFNGYGSEAERRQVYAAYASNIQLMAALRASSEKKAGLTLLPMECIAVYQERLSTPPAWSPGQGRSLVVNVSRGLAAPAGTIFEAEDGQQFAIAAYGRLEDATKALPAFGPGARVLAVRPEWSFPDPAWVASDPEFWRTT